MVQTWSLIKFINKEQCLAKISTVELKIFILYITFISQILKSKNKTISWQTQILILSTIMYLLTSRLMVYRCLSLASKELISPKKVLQLLPILQILMKILLTIHLRT